jgi:sulfonate transport system substrate-binding protein
MIVNGSDVNVTNRDYLLSGKYAGNHKSATKLLIKYLSKDMTWAKTHKTALISMMSKELKLSKAIIARQVNRRSFAMHAVGSTQVAEEQAIADLFYQQGVIKKTIDVSKYVLNLK